MIVLDVLTVLFTYPTARSPNTLVGRSYVRWRRVAVRGPSMSPALHDGDVVLVQWAGRPGQLSVKRAVRPVDDGWWVHGDNPFGSTDSRHLGPAQVVAVVRLRLWPRPARIRAGR